MLLKVNPTHSFTVYFSNMINNDGKDQKQKFPWRTLISGVAVIIVTTLVNQFFFKPNKKVEERIGLRRDIVKENYELYNQLLFWSYVNCQYKLSQIINDSLTILYHKDTWTVALDSNQKFPVTLRLEATVVLSIFIDSNYTKIWNTSYHYIQDNKFKMDADIFNDYRKLVDHLADIKEPKDSSASNLKKIGWILGDAYNKWLDDNYEFRKKIRRYTNLE
jgi:hypothetical protein